MQDRDRIEKCRIFQENESGKPRIVGISALHDCNDLYDPYTTARNMLEIIQYMSRANRSVRSEYAGHLRGIVVYPEIEAGFRHQCVPCISTDR
jgi:hypothetical protein